MAYWRMQLHPDERGESVKHCVKSLAAGYIGLDFAAEVGDLMQTTKERLPEKQKDYWAFAHDMNVGDRVLVIAHHFPFALVRIAGEYNYVRRFAPEIGVWFRHFREVDDVHFYADAKTDVRKWDQLSRKWDQLRMTDTISPLHSQTSQSYLLIEEWLRRLE